jgi:UDP-N-acetylmuramoyl-tripeptide--D-alanyl-D-alanine ligase
MSLGELARALYGQLLQPQLVDTRIDGLAQTDSREVNPGDAYFARVGARLDGHDFVFEAQDRGARLAVVQREVAGLAIPQVLVTDSTEALLQLASFVLQTVRAAGSLRVVGITGSNGKTSTKSMLASILQGFGETVAPKNSFNNEVGTPLTVLGITSQTQFLITELGASGRGSIDRLARWVKPDIGVELKVGHAHVGVFGGLQETARIKAELIPYTQSALVLNADDPLVISMPRPAGMRAVSFGYSAEADYQISDVRSTLASTAFALRVPDGSELKCEISVLGEHQVMNAAAALVTVAALGLDIEQAAESLRGIQMSERWRMELQTRADGLRLINDAYNASPESMRAALQTLAAVGRQEGSRTIAILGEMAELGDYANEAHDEIGRLVVRYNIDQLFVIGEGAKAIHLAATQEGSWGGESEYFASISEAELAIGARLGAGDLVLVKSSNIAGLRFLGDRLAGVEA